MFLSLDRVDVQAELPDGRRLWVQTDHRTAEEIAATEALSTIAALIRCLNARRHAPSGVETVIAYSLRCEPPAFLRTAVERASGHVWLDRDPALLKQPIHPGSVDVEFVEALANASFIALAEEVAAGRRCASPMEALRAYEAELEANGFPEEDDESSFWRTILELAALTGRAIEQTNCGRWRYSPTTIGTLPLTFECSFNRERATANPLGKALKFLREKGGGDEPSAMVAMLAGAPWK
ncbi:MAG: hypothetical protein U0271_24825 [Polyangiaceae bacterium]